MKLMSQLVLFALARDAVAESCQDVCSVKTSLECADQSHLQAGQRRRQLIDLNPLDDIDLNPVDDIIHHVEDVTKKWVKLAGNVLFVFAMYYGFVYLPRKLMLILAIVGVGGPVFFGYILYFMGLGASASVTALAPLLFQFVVAVIAFCLETAATQPGLAILVIFVVGLLTSEVFRWVMKKLGFDLDGDDQISIRDLYVWVLRWVKTNVGESWIIAFALDELYGNACKQLRAVKQNQEILQRMERIEAMLLALGAPDLREEQKKAADGLIDNSSANFHATAGVVPTPTGETKTFDVEQARKDVAKKKKQLKRQAQKELQEEEASGSSAGAGALPGPVAVSTTLKNDGPKSMV